MNWQQTSHISFSRLSYGASCMCPWVKIASHCMVPGDKHMRVICVSNGLDLNLSDMECKVIVGASVESWSVGVLGKKNELITALIRGRPIANFGEFVNVCSWIRKSSNLAIKMYTMIFILWYDYLSNNLNRASLSSSSNLERFLRDLEAKLGDFM